jgi:hypothetical protein
MRMFQLVSDQSAEAILKEGFQDLPYSDLTEDGQVLEGVRLFDSPDGWSPEIKGGNILLAIEIPEDALSGHEVVVMEDEPEIREFLVPAFLVNAYGPPAVEDADINWPGLLEDIYTDDIGDDPE